MYVTQKLEAEQTSSKPQVRNFVTLCMSGHQEKARLLVPKILGLGFYPTGEKVDERFPEIYRYYFSIKCSDIKEPQP